MLLTAAAPRSAATPCLAAAVAAAAAISLTCQHSDDVYQLCCDIVKSWFMPAERSAQSQENLPPQPWQADPPAYDASTRDSCITSAQLGAINWSPGKTSWHRRRPHAYISSLLTQSRLAGGCFPKASWLHTARSLGAQEHLGTAAGACALPDGLLVLVEGKHLACAYM